ncbi:phenylacetate--CoA ligase family protein [Mycobacterium xenopi]|uniref:phenylacetate--CoA ligase family protein n=1 Tax=Mycobacterium xenopi TaxID=1789 RepID=UPI000586B605|nr:phenylacetate--CoA ligase family protein [Mycobacterium xenopi]
MAWPFLTLLAKQRELRRNTKMSRPELEAIKLEKFRRLVRHIKAKSPYYAEIVKEHGINPEICVPQDFPVLTKSMLMANFDRIVTDRKITKHAIAEFLTRSTAPNELLFGEYHVVHTSGTSGEVGYFLYSERDWVQGIAALGRDLAQERPVRKRSGRFRIAYYATATGHHAFVSVMSSATRGIARLLVDRRFFEINSPLPQTVEQLNTFQPEVIGGYTTGLKILAEQQNKGILKVNPIAVTTAAEAMTPADKEIIESAFNCRALNIYGTAEHLVQGLANPDGQTMTLHDDDIIYEIFDDHVLVTNLFNYTQPLIRYRMSDIIRPLAQTHPSSPYLVINSVIGRAEKVPMFTNRDGVDDFISPYTVNGIFVPGITRFQMQVVSKTKFIFKVVLDSSLAATQRAEALAAAEDRLREMLDRKLMDNVAFDVVATDDLPVNPRTRKFQLIVDAPA